MKPEVGKFYKGAYSENISECMYSGDNAIVLKVLGKEFLHSEKTFEYGKYTEYTKPIGGTKWLMVYKNKSEFHFCATWDNKPTANDMKYVEPIALIEVKWEEGQGLGDS